jgi:SAM-dependent methyltransferase
MATQPFPWLLGDEAFDAVYPPEVRRISHRFWTPVETARRAATLLHDAGSRNVLDVGSGVGKFALVAAATFEDLIVTGVEQRAGLVEAARAARRALGITNVRLLLGDATEVPWQPYDGFYFYNSFAENLFDPDDRIDDRAPLSFARFARDVQRTWRLFGTVGVGTNIATYYGCSGRVPCTFELAHQEAAGSGWLRLWTQTDATPDGSFFVEDGEHIVRHPAEGAPHLPT